MSNNAWPVHTKVQRTAAGLAQSVNHYRLTADQREFVGSIPGTRPILRVLKQLRNERISFALITARPSRGLDDHIKIAVPSPRGEVKQCPQLLASCLIHWHSDKLLRFRFTKTLWTQFGRRRNIYRGLVGSPPWLRETSTECKLDVTISSNCQLARKPRITVQTSKKRFSLKPFLRKLVYCSNEQNLKNKTKQKQMNPRPVLVYSSEL